MTSLAPEDINTILKKISIGLQLKKRQQTPDAINGCF